MSEHSESRALCTLPVVPERIFGRGVSANRASLIRISDRKWVNGTVLRYYFFDAPEE